MFGWLRKRIKNEAEHLNITSAFNKVKEDLKEQKDFIAELHKNHSDLHKSHAAFKKNTTINHQRIGEWINHFDRSIKRLEKDILTLENKLYADLAGVVASSSQKLGEEIQIHKAELITFKEELKKELKKELRSEFPDEPDRPVNSFSRPRKPDYEPETGIINVNNVNNVDNVMHNGQDLAYDVLSNPEKWLVGVLFNSEVPLSYAQISEKTGKSISTVRVYMNQLKIKGFVEESALPNGVKIFSLKHKAKVKKLYNL